MAVRSLPEKAGAQQAVVLSEGSDAASPWLPEPFEAGGLEDAPLVRYWRVVQKYRWTITAVTLIVLALATIWTFSRTPLYRASSRIAVYPENADALGLREMDAATAQPGDYAVSLRTQVNILRDPALAAEVIRNLELYQQAAFTQSKGKRKEAALDWEHDAQFRAELLKRFDESLRVEDVRTTQLVDIHFLSPDPRLAAQVVNGLTRAFIEQNFRAKYESTTQTSEWLAEQLADLQLKMEASQERLVRYQREAGILGTDEKQNIITAKLDALNRELMAAEADRIQKEALYRLSRSASPELVANLASDGPLNRLRSEQLRLKTEYAQLSTKLGPAFPTVLEVKNQLQTVEGELQVEVVKTGLRLENDYRAAVDREQMLRRAFEAQKREANRLNESAIQYSALKRDADSNRLLYEGLLARLKEAGVTAGLRSNNVRVIRGADVPARPAVPNVPVNLALGLLGGLLGGVVLAFALEALDNTVSTPEEAQLFSALPSLGVIPLARAEGGNGRQRLKAAQEEMTTALVAHHHPTSEVAESYRALRTSLLFSLPEQEPPKVILFTSPLPQEGKTTTSINTAVVLAQRGERVLLVDTDLRRPAIHKSFGMKAQSGLSRVLGGYESWQQAVRPSPAIPNLLVLPAGPAALRPSEMLGSAAMRALVAEWRREFERVILDSPPVLPVTDPALLSLLADAVVLVVRSGRTTKAALRRSRELLAQVSAPLVGVLVNGMDSRSPDYYDYYGAGYDARYYDQAGD